MDNITPTGTTKERGETHGGDGGYLQEIRKFEAYEAVPLPLILTHLKAGSDRPSRNCICKPASGAHHKQPTVLLKPKEKYTILIDIDNTMNDWDRQFRQAAHTYTDPEERLHYCMEDNLVGELLKSLPDHFRELKGFWKSMPMAEGCRDAVLEMMELGYDVYFLTKPDSKYLGRSCEEKAEWLERLFGAQFKSHMIPCCDKTLVKGHVLIDDNPTTSKGSRNPEWTQVYYCQPYNASQEGLRLCEWKDWKEVLPIPVAALPEPAMDA
ncbi:putative 5'(3')-deoxyribonucleotidase [Gregarina niphandrodes]|uniref:5'(3')-deoxyribonucleotidase n=1 Tax=Gregarina niphandrodes TaxID=110365 RepID=A0A023B4R1_GRENI|nr:putative 5'(3')-deoxyribonucleotidase [Gregarina niphandrodes]EZG57171.1 putative 5'(3')-deoxyribonucleotidase [Gregarina niphandrodes]|eukprot:XP_011131076.1 putative 5'(3')-deoxyribonucleotidase [Gregarina niphandrodes]